MILARKLAKRENLNNNTLAEVTGITKQDVSKIMSGTAKPCPSHARRIADALDYKGDMSKLFEKVEND